MLCLELTNAAELPISLYPGLTVAQVFIHEVKENTTDFRAWSAYLGATELDLPELHLIDEIDKFGHLNL